MVVDTSTEFMKNGHDAAGQYRENNYAFLFRILYAMAKSHP